VTGAVADFATVFGDRSSGKSVLSIIPSPLRTEVRLVVDEGTFFDSRHCRHPTIVLPAPQGSATTHLPVRDRIDRRLRRLDADAELKVAPVR